MTKKIETLVDDIYTLMEKGTPDINNEALDLLAENVKEAIKRAIIEAGEVEDPYLRMSNIGTPDRKLWYTMHSTKEEIVTNKPNGATLIKFLYGHILEEVLLFLCKQAGHRVEGEQDECEILGVKGHRDAKIDNIVVDVKTASSYAFKKFQTGALVRGEDPFGYIPQISSYQKADPEADQTKVAFFAINKESGELCLLRVDSVDLIDPVKRISSIKEMIKEDRPPEKKCYEDIPEGKGGNRILQRQCADWCPFRDKCWRNLRKFKYSNGLKYFTKVVSTPRVEEIE